MVCTWIGMAPWFITAVPVRSPLAVAGRPACDPGTVARLPKPPISAVSRRTVPRFGTGLARGTVRRRRGGSLDLDRPRPWVGLCTARSSRRGPVRCTGNKLRGGVQCGTVLLSRGGLVCPTGLRRSGAWNRWYRPRLQAEPVPAARPYRPHSCTGSEHRGEGCERLTTMDCSGRPSPATAEARGAQRGRRPPLNPSVGRIVSW
jgi:hypothetical protein